MGILLENKLDVFKNIPLDILIGVAFLIAVTMIIILGIMSRGRHIYQEIAKITDLINNIRTTPLFEKIYHISYISEKSNNLQTNFLKWRTIFELTYERTFSKLVNEFFELIDSKSKNVKLSKKTWVKLRNIYSELNQSVYSIQLALIDDINNHLEPERFYRSFYVKMNNLYLHLLTKIDEKIAIGEFTSEAAMVEIKENINEAFQEFYSLLHDGHWDQIKEVSNALENFLSHLINMLDTIPHLNLETKVLITRKMAAIKNRYVTFGDGEGIEERAIRYSELERKVDELRINLNNNIKKVQYLKGRKILHTIYNLIDDYEAFASFEEGVQNKLNIFSSEISEIFSRTILSANMLVTSSSKSVDIKKPKWDHFQLQFLATELSRINDAWSTISSSLDSKYRNKTIDFNKARLQTIKLIDEFIKNSTSVIEFEDKINKTSIDQAKLVDHIVICDSLINQIAVKIVQYHSVPALKSIESKVEHLREEMMKYSNENFKISDVENNGEKIQADLDLIYAEAQGLEMKVETEIFYDFITQELIIYLSRQPEDDDRYEVFISESIAKREQGKYLDVINGTSRVINQIRNKVKG
jgi:hypothetical protein